MQINFDLWYNVGERVRRKDMTIEYIKIDEIKEYEGNAKLHPREQIEQIKKSINDFGMNDPIAIWQGEIVEGHGRLIACRELGFDEIPVIKLDHLTDKQRKAYTLIHNKLTMNSDFDLDILESELNEIGDEIDMSDFGFELVSGDEISYIDDLLETEFVGTSESTKFGMTFNFDKKYEDLMLKYVKENGKDLIVNEIIKFVEGVTDNA